MLMDGWMDGWVGDGIGYLIRTYCGKNAFANQNLPNIYACTKFLPYVTLLKKQ